MEAHDNMMSILPRDLATTRAVVIGASGGIGAAIAVALGKAGAEVILGGRSRDRMTETAGRISASGGVAHVEEVDARDTGSISAFAAAVVDRHGAPRTLINCMGGALYKPALEVTPDEWDDLHSTHLRGSFFMCQAFAPGMRDAGYGKIVNMSSTWAFTVAEGRSVYASAKAGLGHLTSALALEWAPYGVRVNAIAPTTIRTPRVEARLSAEPEAEQYAVSRIPLGRLGTTDDVVGPTLFLTSRASDFVTGHTLLVDGGWVTAK